jgi:hypothetical protein
MAVNRDSPAEAARALGWAYRHDWEAADGKTIRDDLEALADLIEGKRTVQEFRVITMMCPYGWQHWNDACAEDCDRP